MSFFQEPGMEQDSRQFRAGRASGARGPWNERTQGTGERVTETGDLRVKLGEEANSRWDRNGCEKRSRP